MCAWTAAFWLRQDVPQPQSVCGSGQALAAFVELIAPAMRGEDGAEGSDAPAAVAQEAVAGSKREREHEGAEAEAAVGDAQSTPRPAPPARCEMSNWTSTHGEIPHDWPEAADVVGTAYEEARMAPLRFVSRRRAEPEEQDPLARRRMPELARADTGVQEHYAKHEWPADAPPQPIAAEELWLDGVYDEILEAIQDVVQDCAASERGEKVARRETRVFKTELMQPWAQRQVEGGGAFDLADPNDVKLLQPYDDSEPVPQSVDGAFVARWASWLAWQDADMIRQVSVTGIESRSVCTRATTVATHHGGLRANFAPAKAVVDADTQMGFVQRGRAHPWTIPAQMVPRNCVSQCKWKLRGKELTRTLKWRVTTDDSIGAQDEVSRNDGIDQEALSPTVLPTPQTLAEAVAIAKAIAQDMGIQASRTALERVALWAIDLIHAFRMLSVQRSEWPQQAYVWLDGVPDAAAPDLPDSSGASSPSATHLNRVAPGQERPRTSLIASTPKCGRNLALHTRRRQGGRWAQPLGRWQPSPAACLTARSSSGPRCEATCI